MMQKNLDESLDKIYEFQKSTAYMPVYVFDEYEFEVGSTIHVVRFMHGNMNGKRTLTVLFGKRQGKSVLKKYDGITDIRKYLATVLAIFRTAMANPTKKVQNRRDGFALMFSTKLFDKVGERFGRMFKILFNKEYSYSDTDNSSHQEGVKTFYFWKKGRTFNSVFNLKTDAPSTELDDLEMVDAIDFDEGPQFKSDMSVTHDKNQLTGPQFKSDVGAPKKMTKNQLTDLKFKSDLAFTSEKIKQMKMKTYTAPPIASQVYDTAPINSVTVDTVYDNSHIEKMKDMSAGKIDNSVSAVMNSDAILSNKSRVQDKQIDLSRFDKTATAAVFDKLYEKYGDDLKKYEYSEALELIKKQIIIEVFRRYSDEQYTTQNGLTHVEIDIPDLTDAEIMSCLYTVNNDGMSAVYVWYKSNRDITIRVIGTLIPNLYFNLTSIDTVPQNIRKSVTISEIIKNLENAGNACLEFTYNNDLPHILAMNRDFNFVETLRNGVNRNDTKNYLDKLSGESKNDNFSYNTKTALINISKKITTEEFIELNRIVPDKYRMFGLESDQRVHEEKFVTAWLNSGSSYAQAAAHVALNDFSHSQNLDSYWNSIDKFETLEESRANAVAYSAKLIKEFNFNLSRSAQEKIYYESQKLLVEQFGKTKKKKLFRGVSLGVSSTVLNGYTPGVLESWTSSKSSAKKFSSFVLTGSIPISGIFSTYDILRQLYGSQVASDSYSQEKEYIVMGGALANIEITSQPTNYAPETKIPIKPLKEWILNEDDDEDDNYNSEQTVVNIITPLNPKFKMLKRLGQLAFGNEEEIIRKKIRNAK